MNVQRIAIALAVIAATVFGQQPDNNANRDRFDRMRVSRSLNYGNWVGRHIMNKEFMEQVGIKDEQAKKIKDEMDKIDARLKTIDETISQAAIQQAEIAKKVLSEPGASIDEMMKLIDQIGQFRTEQAKLSTQILVIIRDSLTEEQRKKAQELIAAEGQKRVVERAAAMRRDRDRDRDKDERERPGAQRPPAPGGAQRPPAPGAQRPPAPARPEVPKGW
jgi:hypothetical protein